MHHLLKREMSVPSFLEYHFSRTFTAAQRKCTGCAFSSSAGLAESIKFLIALKHSRSMGLARTRCERGHRVADSHFAAPAVLCCTVPRACRWAYTATVIVANANVPDPGVCRQETLGKQRAVLFEKYLEHSIPLASAAEPHAPCAPKSTYLYPNLNHNHRHADGRVRVLLLRQADTHLPKPLACALHDLYLALMADQPFKTRIAAAYVRALPAVTANYARGVGTAEHA